MMHTLKKQYTRQRLLKKLQLVEATTDPQHRRILLEAFNEAEAKQVIARIESIGQFATTYNLPALSTAAKKAADEAIKLSGILGIPSQGLAKLKALGQGVSKIFAFTAAITQSFKQLPTVMQFIEKTAPLSDEDKEKPFLDVADPALLDRARKGLTKAMAPPGLLGFIRGVPYLDDKAMVTELLANSFNSLTAMTEDSNNPANQDTPIADKDDVENAVAAAKGEKGAEALVTAPDDKGAIDIPALAKKIGISPEQVEAAVAELKSLGLMERKKLPVFVAILQESLKRHGRKRAKQKKRA